MKWEKMDSAPKDRAILGFERTIDGPIQIVMFWSDLPIHVYADPAMWKPPYWANAHCGHKVSPSHWMELPDEPR